MPPTAKKKISEGRVNISIVVSTPAGDTKIAITDVPKAVGLEIVRLAMANAIDKDADEDDDDTVVVPSTPRLAPAHRGGK